MASIIPNQTAVAMAEISVVVIFSVYLLILGRIIYTDIKHHKIYNWVILWGSLFAIGAAIWQGTILNALLGGLVGLVAIGLARKITKGGVGYGDIKLGLLIGLVFGVPLTCWVLFWGVFGGGILAAILLITKRMKGSDKLPFGVALSLSAMVFLVLGLF